MPLEPKSDVVEPTDAVSASPGRKPFAPFAATAADGKLSRLGEVLGFTGRGPTKYVSWCVLVLALAITAAAWQFVHGRAQYEASAELEKNANSVLNRINRRVLNHEQALNSIVALFAAKHRVGSEVSDAEWQTFLGSLKIDRNYPGVLGIGFAQWLAAKQTSPVRFVYPQDEQGLRTIGFNAFSRPIAREAMERARDSGATAISTKINLVLVQNRPGVMIYLPVYRHGAPTNTVEQRRAAIWGFVSAAFKVEELLAGTFANSPSEIRFAVYDGNDIDPARLLYDSASSRGSVTSPFDAPKLYNWSFGGRQWTFAFAAQSVPGRSATTALAVLASGVLISMLLFGLTAWLTDAIERQKKANAIIVKRDRHGLAFSQLGRHALITTDIDAVIEKALDTVSKTIGAKYIGLLEYVPATKELLRRAGRGWGDEFIGSRVPADFKSSASHSLSTGQPAVIGDTLTEQKFAIPQALHDHGIRSTVTVPIQDGDSPWGVLTANSLLPHAFAEDDVMFLQTVGNIMAEAIRRQKAGEILQQALKMEAVGQLTGGIAHDFNNLLTVVMGNMELLLDDERTPDTLKPALNMTMQAAGRGADLTKSMLAFSRRQPLQPKTLELNRVVESMDVLLRRAIGENIEIETHFAADLWKMHVDQTQLETAILNLAINARDAMPNGGRLIVETSNTIFDEEFAATNEIPRIGAFVCLAISDTGTGMEPGVAARVFEPFFTTKEVGKGSGLGLSMVYGFVRQSNGYVRLYSELGHGTVIRIYLPRADHEDHRMEAHSAVQPHARGTETILIVEDDPLVRELAVGMIRRLNYDVIVATDGPSALVALDSDQKIDLVFTDIVMPGGMSGTEVAAEAQRRRPGLKVLLTSGYSEHTISKSGQPLLAYPLIAKPYRVSDVAQRIRVMLDERKLDIDSAA